MTQEELWNLAEKYSKRSQRAFEQHQETGVQRYYREYRQYDDLATALTMAASAAETHHKYISLRASVSEIAYRMAQGKEKPEDLCKELVAVARMDGILQEGNNDRQS